MSAQAVSRIAALLALNAEMLRNYLPGTDGSDDNEEARADLVEQYENQLTQKEAELLVAGDLNAVFQYIQSHLERPLGGDEGDPGG
jgi:hypothetical protein